MFLSVTITSFYYPCLQRVYFMQTIFFTSLHSIISQFINTVIFFYCTPGKIVRCIIFFPKSSMSGDCIFRAYANKGFKNKSMNEATDSLSVMSNINFCVSVFINNLRYQFWFDWFCRVLILWFHRIDISVFVCKVVGEVRYFFKHNNNPIKKVASSLACPHRINYLATNPQPIY